MRGARVPDADPERWYYWNKCQVAEQLENWNLVMHGCKLCKRLGQKREMRVALYVKEQLESMGFMCEGFDSM